MNTILPQAAMKKFTELGDPTFLVFVALGAFFYLWVSGQRRLAGHLAFTVGLSTALTIGAKIGFILAHDLEPTLLLRSPSGHIAIATTVYGCCAMMLAAPGDKLVRWGAFTVTALFLLALAGTRLALQLHNIAEVVVGFFIGIGCLAVFASCFRARRHAYDVGQLAALLLLLGGTRFARIDAEEMIAYGIRMARAMLASDIPVEQSALFFASRYRIEHFEPASANRFPTLSNGPIAIVCGGRNG